MNNIIAQRIRRLRQSRDLSQDNVADDLGITKGAYSKIERGMTAISVDRLSQIAKIFDVDIVSFFNSGEIPVTAEHLLPYGFATKQEIEELAGAVADFRKELNNIKKLLADEPRRKKAVRKRGGR